MTRRSQAQEDAVHKAARVSGERRRAAKRRREDTELREAQEHRAEVVIRLDMSLAEAERIADLMPHLPTDVRERLHDQLWLCSVFTEQRRRLPLRDHGRFGARANRLLALLDPQEDER